jgi:hypothetical protein
MTNTKKALFIVSVLVVALAFVLIMKENKTTTFERAKEACADSSPQGRWLCERYLEQLILETLLGDQS